MTHFRSILKLIGVCIFTISLVACSSSRDYKSINPKAKAVKPIDSALELPPDLIDSANDSVVYKQLTEEDVVPEQVGVRVIDDGQKRWLEIDAPAEEVWTKLVNYWGNLGALLVVNDPKTGIMETEWVHEEKNPDGKGSIGNSNILVGILTDISNQDTSLDKYTVRVERTVDAKSHVYLGHRGSKKIQIGKASIATQPKWEWVETDEDPEKVKTILQSIRYNLNPDAA